MQITVHRFLFDFDGVLKDAGIDTLTQDKTYLDLYDGIWEIAEGLPPNIIQNISTYILMSNILDMTFLLRKSQPFMKEYQIPTRVRILLPYQTLAIDTELRKLSGQISGQITKYLAGG
jgi:hypothetical protein